MEIIKPGSYNIIFDEKTNEAKLEPNQNSIAIEYTDQELKSWIDAKHIPPNLAKHGIAFFHRMQNEFKDRQNYIKNNPNYTEKEYIQWVKSNNKIHSLEDSKKEIDFLKFILDNIEFLKSIPPAIPATETFALPSHSLMFSLLAMFAGKPERIPRELLEKPHNERTALEKEEAEKYLNDLFEIEYDYSNITDNKPSEKRIALICDNPIVESRAEIQSSLLKHDILFREERLAIYIKRTFGAEGIRHLLGLIIGLEENFRKGHFVWSVNEHLERLGYRRRSNRSFDPELKKMASEIIRIFTRLCITIRRKNNKTESIKGQFLFMIGGFEVEKKNEAKTVDQEIINEKITLVASDFWYDDAFSPKDGQSQKYTKLLKAIVKENHREHPLVLYLAPLFAIFWRINPEKKIRVKNLMEWCDLDTEGKYRSEYLRDLESTLEYMKSKTYLGEWTNNGESKFPSQCINPYECILTLTPPDWLKQELNYIHQKRDVQIIAAKQTTFSHQDFIQIFSESGLSRKQFANSIGVTPQLITAIINGKRKITPETSDKLHTFVSQRKETT